MMIKELSLHSANPKEIHPGKIGHRRLSSKLNLQRL